MVLELTYTKSTYLLFIRISFSYQRYLISSRDSLRTQQTLPIFLRRLQSSSLKAIPLFLNVHWWTWNGQTCSIYMTIQAASDCVPVHFSSLVVIPSHHLLVLPFRSCDPSAASFQIWFRQTWIVRHQSSGGVLGRQWILQSNVRELCLSGPADWLPLSRRVRLPTINEINHSYIAKWQYDKPEDLSPTTLYRSKLRQLQNFWFLDGPG